MILQDVPFGDRRGEAETHEARHAAEPHIDLTGGDDATWIEMHVGQRHALAVVDRDGPTRQDRPLGIAPDNVAVQLSGASVVFVVDRLPSRSPDGDLAAVVQSDLSFEALPLRATLGAESGCRRAPVEGATGSLLQKIPLREASSAAAGNLPCARGTSETIPFQTGNMPTRYRYDFVAFGGLHSFAVMLGALH